MIYDLNIVTLRMVKEQSVKYDTIRKITDPESIFNMFTQEPFNLCDMAEEYVYMVSVDTKNQPNGVHMISHGSINSSILNPADIFKRALLHNSAAIVLVHNHPSGDPTPSQLDKDITRRVKECGEILNIQLLDHIIIGSPDYEDFCSLKQMGLC